MDIIFEVKFLSRLIFTDLIKIFLTYKNAADLYDIRFVFEKKTNILTNKKQKKKYDLILED